MRVAEGLVLILIGLYTLSLLEDYHKKSEKYEKSENLIKVTKYSADIPTNYYT